MICDSRGKQLWGRMFSATGSCLPIELPGTGRAAAAAAAAPSGEFIEETLDQRPQMSVQNPEADREHDYATAVFFRVAEKPLTASTFLGQTSMVDVDFFCQTATLLQHVAKIGRQPESVLIEPNDTMVVATRLYFHLSE